MPVVIKFLLDDSTQNVWLGKKFLQEAEALTRIKHPGVVKVIDRDRTEFGKPFFVMEFVRGRSLRSAITADGIDLDYAATLIRQIGQALNAAHREGVFHRDLKPENIMLETLSDGDEQIKLIDFGIAKLRDSESGATTGHGMVAGSLNYMAPEQLTGQNITAATDIYTFGIIAYELIAGRRPFNPDSRSQLIAMQQLMAMQQTDRAICYSSPATPQSAGCCRSDSAEGIVFRCEQAACRRAHVRR
jgi:serine/threonine-protein kinase